MWRLVFVVCLLTSACSPATLTMSGTSPTTPVAQSGSYRYSVSTSDLPPSPDECPNISYSCVRAATDCTYGLAIRLSSDSGAIDYVTAESGRTFLSTGSWTGEDVTVISATKVAPRSGCAWSLTLTPIG